MSGKLPLDIYKGVIYLPQGPKISSTELGTLWTTYQEKTMIMRMLEYFIEKADDEKAKTIQSNLYDHISAYVEKIKQLFESEGAAIPVGFTSQDVNIEAPKLYDNGFDILFLRLIKSISMGLHTLHLSMAYREDLVTMYKELTSITQSCYNECTQYLLEKGLLTRPPYVSMPTSVEFVQNNNYLSGRNPFVTDRALNTVETGHVFYAIESNIVGMQMITGFGQCANDKEVQQYFAKGVELSKSVITEFSEMLLQSGIPAPATPGGNATRSTAAPFSDKLMMYCTSLFCSFALGKNSLGTAFSLRSDIPAKGTIFSKDIFEYAKEGAKIMIKNGWMEEPPQMEERNELLS